MFKKRNSRLFAIRVILFKLPDQQNRIYMDLDIQFQESQKTLNQCVKWEKVQVHITCDHIMIPLRKYWMRNNMNNYNKRRV